MSNNPFSILGVRNGASEAECTRAYKRLAKKYHPDLNPDDAVAAKRMTEINAAYEEIKKNKGFSAAREGEGGFEEERQSNEDKAHINAAAQFINNRQFAQALNVLSRIESRTAQWYFLAAIANERAGRDRIAYMHIKEACAIAPDNADYKAVYDRLLERGADERPRARSAYYDDYTVPDPNAKRRRR